MNSLLSNLNSLYTNQYFLGVMVACTAIYLVIVRNQAPKFLDNILKNPLFLFVVIAYALYKVNDDIQTSVVLTFTFLLVMSLLRKHHYENFKSEEPSEEKPKAHCYESNNDHNTDYCNLSDENMKSAQCNYCPDKKQDSK